MTETAGQHKHSFPCDPPAAAGLHPGPCACGKTCEQDEADRLLVMALEHLERAYGIAPRVSTRWCVAWGGEDANDCAGRLEYDDEADCREMTQWIDGGLVARQTVISLPWETVSGEEPAP